MLLTLDAAATLRSVCWWSSNTRPEAIADVHCDSGFDTRIGLLLGVESLAAKVQMGGIDPGPEQAAAYRPRCVPGLHRSGMVNRGDGSVSLPLAATVKTDLRSAIDLLNEILDGCESQAAGLHR